MVTPNPARVAKLSAAIDGAFGEMFTITAYKRVDDVNSRPVPDTSRLAFTAEGIWDGPAKSKTPPARGDVAENRAHNWIGTFLSANFSETALTWIVMQGDTITRQLDGTTYSVVDVYPTGFGRITITFSARKRS